MQWKKTINRTGFIKYVKGQRYVEVYQLYGKWNVLVGKGGFGMDYDVSTKVKAQALNSASEYMAGF